MNIPFHKPIISSDIVKNIQSSLDTGWLTTGPKVKDFEKKLEEYLGAKHVIAVNSCTAALHLALSAIKLEAGDSFIAPTYTFVASVEVGEYLGASPVLVDSDIDTYNLDLNEVEKKLIEDKEHNIKAIIPVHFAGLSVDMKKVYKLAEKYDLFVLEDAAHALESISNMGKVGKTNHAVAFSFYANKNITSGGEGGALATDDSTLADKVRKLSLHGMDKDGWKRFERGGKWGYDVSELGYKYNMTDISASFGIDQLSQINSWSERRLQIAEYYERKISNINGITTPKFVNNNSHAWHLYVIRIDSSLWSINRNKLIELINSSGIGTSVHYIPVHMHSYYRKKYGYKENEFPNAKKLSESVITLPLYPSLSNNELDYITSTINDLWEEYKL